MDHTQRPLEESQGLGYMPSLDAKEGTGGGTLAAGGNRIREALASFGQV